MLLHSFLRILTGLATCYCGDAMNVKDIRRQNLVFLTKDITLEEFEDRSGASAAYATQVINGFREMGDRYAKTIQDGLKLPAGWMDKLHGEDEAKEAVMPNLVNQRKKIQNVKHLTALFRQMDSWAKSRKIGDLTPNQRAILFQRAIEADESEESPNYEAHFDNVIEMSRHWKTR